MCIRDRGIAVQIEEESWGRNLVMDTTKLERFGIRFDTTQQGIQRCLKAVSYTHLYHDHQRYADR